MSEYHEAFAHDFDENHDVEEPKPVRRVAKRAATASWKSLAAEDLEGTAPTLPIGKCFCAYLQQEKRDIEGLVAAIRDRIVNLALDQPELSPRELAVRFTDEEKYFVSEASVYRLLKAHDLIASPAYIVIKAAEEFKDKTTAPNQLWQTDFTYLKITRSGWRYLSTVRDDCSRFLVAWKLCATMKAQDVTATLDLALAAAGLDQMTVAHRPRLLSDNGSSYIASDLADWLDKQNIEHVRGAPFRPQTQGKIEHWNQTLKNRILASITPCPAISNARSRPSSSTTTMPAITKASAISLRLTSTSRRATDHPPRTRRIKRQTIANRRLQHQLHAA